jgi:hypothetical protein
MRDSLKKKRLPFRTASSVLEVCSTLSCFEMTSGIRTLDVDVIFSVRVSRLCRNRRVPVGAIGSVDRDRVHVPRVDIIPERRHDEIPANAPCHFEMIAARQLHGYRTAAVSQEPVLRAVGTGLIRGDRRLCAHRQHAETH